MKERKSERRRGIARVMGKVAKILVLKFIRLYQLLLSPWVGRQCRFYPTCSHYATQAIEAHGILRGSWLTAKRLGKCHPFHPGGVDLVPDPQTAGQTSK